MNEYLPRQIQGDGQVRRVPTTGFGHGSDDAVMNPLLGGGIPRLKATVRFGHGTDDNDVLKKKYFVKEKS